MDNLTHTLVGAVLAETGLKRRTALGSATLIIGANFPDIDVLAVPLGYGIEWRRGITHGIPAHFVLPFVLAGIMWLWDRHVRRRRDAGVQPADFGQLVILSAIAILTHPALDFMNTYGMRWLMPFVNKWFYADGLFIVDLWILSALIVAFIWSRRARSPRPAQAALAAVGVYAVMMLVVTEIGRRQVGELHPDKRFMVAPAPVVPWHRDVVLDVGRSYRFGTFSLVGGVTLGEETIAKGEGEQAVELARQLPLVRAFLGWARFPFYRVSQRDGETVVRIVDARYHQEGSDGWASVEVRLP